MVSFGPGQGFSATPGKKGGTLGAMVHAIAYSSLTPPNLFILAALIGTLLAWRSRRFGLWLATAAIGCLYLVSTPVVAHWLIREADALAGAMPKVAAQASPRAIIVLGGDMGRGSASGEPDPVGPITFERLATAAQLQQHLGLPILVSGGVIDSASDTLAAAMSRALENDFRVPVRWREDRSRNTYENALFSAAILRRAGIPAALVVTHPWHMARALWSFAKVGYPVIPAPTPDFQHLPTSAAMLLPQTPSLFDSYHALHEMIGLAWYLGRYRNG
jgi:uncharacterized SAM-binding protein YcdF (DUF218 family)